MVYIQGTTREQIILFPEAIDDYIKEGNPVQFVEAFVENLDLKSLQFKYSQLKATGRPPYNPADMLKLYIYGYLNRIRSSRRLEAEAERNVELMWLLKKLTPDFKTIADFRKDNLDSIKEVCKEFTLICKKLDLFGAELVAIDSSKFRAKNAKKRNFSKAKLQKSLKKIEEKVDEYILELEENDQKEAGFSNPTKEELKEKIKALKDRKSKYQELQKKIEDSGETEVSLTDPDSRAIMNAQRVEVCYNVQMTVDAKHKLILDHKVTNEPADQHQLTKMAKRAKRVLQVKELEVLADKGYYDAREIKESSDDGIVLYIPRPTRNRPQKDELYSKEKFRYDQQKDVYLCPSGHKLTFSKKVTDRGKAMRLYSCNKCPNCQLKAKCTKAQSRTILRWEHEAVLEEMWERVKSSKEKVRTRQWLTEHPFGTIKRSFDQGYMLLRGLDKVGTEFSLSFLAYNIKRAINIVGIKNLIAAVG